MPATKPYKRFFIKALNIHFPDTGDELIVETDMRFKRLFKDVEFAARSSNPVDWRLDFSAYFLALIQTLESRGLSYEKIRSICLEITYDYVRPKNALHRWLRQLPRKLIGSKIAGVLLKMFNKRISTKGHPDGFRAVLVTDKAQTHNLGYGIDILECGICKLFQKHRAARYASILCEVDKVTSGLAGLELIRNGTIANGADKCDFRFKRI